ncbi:Thiol-disulfide isomerase or thioredoxin [Streptomyces sp. DvalAA-14]|uniref:TlpA family protein disulfide reductase n=1 Tax=unclassified Streptomyces TaxID=2593676 RepID=UPI00081B4251|nr:MULTISPECIES: TlpA disulfide reductase family protein [unclassified Streptomyces]MYS20182.1 redoxin domain-containing protein [Streptomyces sp. SID4948]SCD62714.1 Thiol-disulfide isomerase or thioredoxin [Streptomyces sp. DvalAA-14]
MSPTRAHRRRPLRTAAVLAGTVVLALAAAACSSSSSGSSAGSSNFVGGTGEITTVKAADRQAAPDLSGKTVSGGQASLASYKGKVVVINIWGSWCAPCRAEAPNLAAVAAADQAKGVQFLGINTRDLDASNAARFDKTFHITYPSLFDPYGKLILRFPKGSLNPQSLPATLVVDRQGRVAVRALKALSETELHQIVDPIAAEK